ncbi:hypothetical protein [Metabacillus fastidiosus]|uniref:hypothetical protein n=1 Tax=Metabacillus fastidiosus TaxID=1458 RepID=UPI003D2AA332
MLKYDKRIFKSLFHFKSINHIEQIEENGNFPIEIHVTIRNKEIEIPAVIILDFLKKPVCSMKIGEVISDFELLYAAVDCFKNISLNKELLAIINTKQMREEMLKSSFIQRGNSRSNMELFYENVKYKINDYFYESREQVDIIVNNTDLLLSKMNDVKIILQQINDYISSLTVKEETKSLYFYCLQSFYEWLFYTNPEQFPSVTAEVINKYLQAYDASNYYKNLAIKQVLKLQKNYHKHLKMEGVHWQSPAPKVQTFYSETILIETEVKLLKNLGTHKRQIEDYNHYLRSIGHEPHSYSRLRDLMRNWIYFRLAAETMLKSRELIALNFENIDFENLRIVIEKGNKKQIVAITKQTADYLKKYKKFRNAYDDTIEEEKHYYRWMYGSVLKDKNKKEEEMALILPFLNDLERREFNEIEDALKKINEQIVFQKKPEYEKVKEVQSLGELRRERKELNNRFARKYAEVKRKYSNKLDENMKSALFVSSHSKRVNVNTMEKILNQLDITTEVLRVTRYKQVSKLQVSEPALMKIMGYEHKGKIKELEFENTLKMIEKSRIDFFSEKKIDELIKSMIIETYCKHLISKYPAINKERLKREVKEKYSHYDFSRSALLEGVFERSYEPLEVEKEMGKKV